MSAKRIPKKTTRQKRLIHSVTATPGSGLTLNKNSPRGSEAAIIRQFHQIQKGYTRLMTDVAKELDLVKEWIGSQAVNKQRDIKARLSARLSKN